ncbi:glutamate receptor ionotropic, NMDA 1-like [Convolutriloba macropyga]|uniref:glutamate receptor ionotropic, NMDA 1-like n=1 Tax=Convolutriloba macropyga TaxID=536237 RepID=UPI003F52864A
MSIVIICFFTSVLPCFCFANYHINDFKNIRIGGVFHNAETKNSFLDAIDRANNRQQDKFSYQQLLQTGIVSFGDKSSQSVVETRDRNLLWKDTRLVASEFVAWDLQTNISLTIEELCHYVFEKNQGVHVIVWDLSDPFLTTVFLQLTSQYRIPVIITNFRYEVGQSLQQIPFEDKATNTSTIFMQPTFAQEMTAVLYLMQFYSWPHLVLIAKVGQDTDAALKIVEDKQETMKPFQYHPPILFTTTESIRVEVAPKLKAVRGKNKVNVFAVLAEPEDAHEIFAEAHRLQLLDPKYVWIVSERVINGPIVPPMPEGLIGFQANIPNRERRIRDAVKMIVRAHREESRKGEAFYVLQKSCYTPEVMILDRKPLTGALLNTSMFGSDGLVEFDKQSLAGHRATYNYTLLNLQKNAGSHQLQWKSMGEFFVQSNASLTLRSIKWIGGTSNVPSPKSLGGSFRFVTVNEKPFLVTLSANYSADTEEDLNLVKMNRSLQRRLCPVKKQILCYVHRYNVTAATLFSPDYTRIRCCTGVHVDFLFGIVESIYKKDEQRPDFSMHVVVNSTYGLFHQKSQKFTGVLGKVADETFDLVFGPISMTADRSRFFDFSHVYYWSNLVVVTKRREKTSDPSSILRPFDSMVWLMIAMAVFVVSVSLWIVEKYSPFGTAKTRKEEEKEGGLGGDGKVLTARSQFDATNSSWYTIGVLLGVSLMSMVPKATSSKLISLIWSLFCLLALTTYTANLAAFMVSEKPTLTFPQGFFRDPRVRNPTDDFIISTVCESFVIEKFRNDEEYLKLAQHMEKKCVRNTGEGLEKVKRSEVNAFVWDSGPTLFHTLGAAKQEDQCQLVISEVIASSGGYALAGNRGNPFLPLANLAILATPLTTFESLYDKWLPESLCDIYENSGSKSSGFLSGYTHQITAEHATGILYVLIAGMILGGVLLPLETHFYQRYSNYFRGHRTSLLWDVLMDSKKGISLTDAERNEILTQKVIRLRSQQDTLAEKIDSLENQLVTAEQENEGLRRRLLHDTPGGTIRRAEADIEFNSDDGLLDDYD